MEDVVIHYQPGSGHDLRPLIEKTENLLQPFPCRPPPVFRPWFSDTDRRPPIRPAKPAPVVPPGPLFRGRPWTHTTPEEPEEHGEDAQREKARPQEPSPGEVAQEDKDARSVSPSQRSWSICGRRPPPSSSQPLSKRLRGMVSVHRLHLRQRARWVIEEHNCGASRDLEQVWRTLSQSVQRLPTCHANIQRQRAEIWVFCDVVCSEQVGRFLKEELQLHGSIRLSVHRAENIFSM